MGYEQLAGKALRFQGRSDPSVDAFLEEAGVFGQLDFVALTGGGTIVALDLVRQGLPVNWHNAQLRWVPGAPPAYTPGALQPWNPVEFPFQQRDYNWVLQPIIAAARAREFDPGTHVPEHFYGEIPQVACTGGLGFVAVRVLYLAKIIANAETGGDPLVVVDLHHLDVAHLSQDGYGHGPPYG